MPIHESFSMISHAADAFDASCHAPIPISTESINSVGLPGLPSELLHEIASHLPVLPFPLAQRSRIEPHLVGPVHPSEPPLLRTQALRALTATCRSLRQFALPLAWESIEVLSSKHLDAPPEEWKEELATSLIAQLEFVLVVRPELAACVKSIAVLLADSDRIDATYELARRLHRFPNLHTVQLLGCFGNSVDFADALEGQKLPSIRRLSLPPFAQPLIKCCPNLQMIRAIIDDLNPHDVACGRNMLRDVMAFCPNLEELLDFSVAWGRDFEDLSKACPKLRVIPLQIFHTADSKHLDTIEVLPRFMEMKNLEQIVLDLPLGAIATQNGEWFRHVEDIIERCLRVLWYLPVSEKMTPTPYWPIIKKWIREEDEITPKTLLAAKFPLCNGHRRQPPLFSKRMNGIKYLTINLSGTPIFFEVVLGPRSSYTDEQGSEEFAFVFYQKGERSNDVFQEVILTARPVLVLKYLNDTWPYSDSEGEEDEEEYDSDPEEEVCMATDELWGLITAV